MPEANSPSETAVPLGTLLMLTCAALGLLAFSAPLTSSRPTVESPPKARHSGDQGIEARLWQDPILALETELAAQVTNSSEHLTLNLRDIAKQLGNSLTNSTCTNGSVRIMFSMVSGGPYSIDAETRLRSRYAILSAFGAAGFSPKDSEHLGFFQADWPSKEDLSGMADDGDKGRTGRRQRESIFVPFEWFKPCPTTRSTDFCRINSEVLLCWLRSEDFADHPLRRFALLELEIRTNLAAFVPAATAPSLKFVLLGPRTSTGLKDMLGDDEQAIICTNNRLVTVKDVLAGTQVFSPWATAAEALLNEQALCGPNAQQSEDILAHKGIELRKCTATDDELANILLRELKLRGVDLRNAGNEVVLLAEWDTFYGRALPMTFMAQAAVIAGKTNSFCDALQAIRSNSSERLPLRKYSYLRGVDGEVGSLLGNPSRKDGKIAETGSEKKNAQEFPEGQGQWDYVRRIASRVAEDMRRWRAFGKVKAIGVLGGDVYDKLLLLQALQEQIRGVLFFTTDLDVLYLDRTQQAWSRNLLVASSFGLELPGFQQDIPPFRDSYQTAQFRACLSALGKPMGQIDPVLFEIGRTEAVQLEIDGKIRRLAGTRNAQTPPEKPFSKARRLYLTPSREMFRRWIQSIIPPSIPILFLIVLAPCIPPLKVFLLELVGCDCASIRTSLRDPELLQVDQLRTRLYHTIFLALFGGIIVMQFIMLLTQGWWLETEEPLRWFEGVSIWPTEFARMAAFFLSVLFVAKSALDLEEGQITMAKFFGSPIGKPSAPSMFKWSRLKIYYRAWRQHRRAISLTFWPPRNPVEASELFAQYCKRAYWKHRFVRCIPIAVVLTFLGFALMLWLGFPSKPVRGYISSATDYILLGASLVSAILLVCFIFDATRLCRVFVEHLGEAKTDWPDHLLKRAAFERGLSQEDVGGLLDMKVVAEHTAKVGRMVYYPACVLLLLIIGHNKYFDRWQCLSALLIMAAICILYSIHGAITLRSAAEKIRSDALAEIDLRKAVVMGRHVSWSVPFSDAEGQWSECRMYGTYSEKLDQTRREVVEEKQGAFAPFLLDPAIGGIIYSSLGAIIVALTQYFHAPA